MADVAAGRERVGEAARERIDRAREQARSVDRDLRAFLDERPLLALASVVAAGFVLGRVLSRR
jgi:ElaB/YqjD/DUF883 family membrane-anchored ribosome-binding protein